MATRKIFGSFVLFCVFCITQVPSQECKSPLGMEDGRIEYSQITVTGFASKAYGWQARLRKNIPKWGAWCADVSGGKINKRNYDQYIQIDLLKLTKITGIATQGRKYNGGREKVKDYKLAYKKDGGVWDFYREKNQNVKTFSGNTDVSTVVPHNLDPAVLARYIRVHPGYDLKAPACMRLELYGCVVKEVILSYSMPFGQTAKNGRVHYRDTSYNGVITNDFYKDGTGILTDGKFGPVGSKQFKGEGWVGWKFTQSQYIDITFEFSGVRKFTDVTLIVNVDKKRDNAVFDRSRIFLSSTKNGFSYTSFLQYCPRNFPAQYNPYNANVTLSLCENTARFVKFRLYFGGEWLLITEISFNSVPASGNEKKSLQNCLRDACIVARPSTATATPITPFTVSPKSECIVILSYSMPVGLTTRNGTVHYKDTSYNGVITNGFYNNGTGILTDGKFGPVNATLFKGEGWVGWSSILTQSQYIDITFEFSGMRKFNDVTLTVNVDKQRSNAVFNRSQIFFASTKDGFSDTSFLHYCPRDFKAHDKPYNANVNLSLCENTARFMKLRLYFGKTCLLISEISFNSVPASGNENKSLQDCSRDTCIVYQSSTTALPNPECIDCTTLEDESTNSTAMFVGIGVTLAIVLIVLVVILTIYKRRRQTTKLSTTVDTVEMQNQSLGEQNDQEQGYVYPVGGTTPVELEYATPTDETTPVELEYATPIDGTTPVELEHVTPIDGTTPVELEYVTPIDETTPVELEYATTIDGTTPVELEYVTPIDGTTPVELEYVTPIDGETPVELECVTPIDGTTPVELEYVTPIDGETPVELEYVTPINGKTPVELEYVTPIDGETPVELEYVTPIDGTTPVELEYVTPIDGTTPVELEYVTPIDGTTPDGAAIYEEVLPLSVYAELDRNRQDKTTNYGYYQKLLKRDSDYEIPADAGSEPSYEEVGKEKTFPDYTELDNTKRVQDDSAHYQKLIKK